jgi:alpha-beta hydrolase superfamily lysophospholipase
MSSTRRTWPRVLVGPLILALGLIAVAGLSGPLFPFKPSPLDRFEVVEKAADLDDYLHEREAQRGRVRWDLAKGVLWNDPAARNKTALSLAYLHGFSASRKDISPVVETLARRLGANAYFARLAAHGRTTPEEFATVTAQDWLDDAREALAIGRRIGDRVILIGTSTGALLATMAALEDRSSKVAALVLLSPNFAIQDWRAKYISGPMGPWLARIFIGKDYSFRPVSSGHADFWTSRYPSEGTVALMNLVNHARSLQLGSLEVPTLIIYTHNDTVVDTQAIRDRFGEIQSKPKQLVDLPEATRHELTGDALAPATVGPVLDRIAEFLSAAGLLGAPPANAAR